MLVRMLIFCYCSHHLQEALCKQSPVPAWEAGGAAGLGTATGTQVPDQCFFSKSGTSLGVSEGFFHVGPRSPGSRL